MIIDCISDLHGHYPELEGGDLLIVAGDLTARDTLPEYEYFFNWCNHQNYKKTVFICGNHDGLFAGPIDASKIPHSDESFVYLKDSGTEFEGLKIWGSPWTRSFFGMNPKCRAFTLDTEQELFEKWRLIPKDTNILITHCPSFGNYDWIKNRDGSVCLSVGSITLWIEMLTLLPKLKLHVTGHIHEAYGESKHFNGIHLVNASHVNEYYEPVNKPIRIVL